MVVALPPFCLTRKLTTFPSNSLALTVIDSPSVPVCERETQILIEAGVQSVGYPGLNGSTYSHVKDVGAMAWGVAVVWASVVQSGGADGGGGWGGGGGE